MHIATSLETLKLHEGYRQFPYKDSVGILTIGYGRNLESRGISRDEAAYLLEQDVLEAERWLVAKYAFYQQLSGQRKAVLIDMLVNLGPTRLAKFRKMLGALEAGDYELAALEMLDSKWATQVGQRALTLSATMNSNII